MAPDAIKPAEIVRSNAPQLRQKEEAPKKVETQEEDRSQEREAALKERGVQDIVEA